MVMGMTRNRIGGRSQFHMNGSLSNDFLSAYQSGKDFYTVTIRSTGSDFLFLIAFSIQLKIDESQSLFFCKCRNRKTDHSLTFASQQPHFYKRTGNNIAAIIELKRYRHIERSLSRSLSVSQQASLQVINR